MDEKSERKLFRLLDVIAVEVARGRDESVELRGEFAELREEVGKLRGEVVKLRQEAGNVRREMLAGFDRIEQRFIRLDGSTVPVGIGQGRKRTSVSAIASAAIPPARKALGAPFTKMRCT